MVRRVVRHKSECRALHVSKTIGNITTRCEIFFSSNIPFYLLFAFLINYRYITAFSSPSIYSIDPTINQFVSRSAHTKLNKLISSVAWDIFDCDVIKKTTSASKHHEIIILRDFFNFNSFKSNSLRNVFVAISIRRVNMLKGIVKIN